MTRLITDSVDLALDSTGDLVIPLRHTVGVEGVAQAIRIAVGMYRGEWFLDLDAGVPYLEGPGIDPSIVILGATFSRSIAEAILRAEIVKVEDVASVISTSVEFDGETRALTLAYEAITTFGDTVADSLEIDA